MRGAAVLAVCLFILTACSCGPGSCGLPPRPEETAGPGPPPLGHIVYQLPFLPLTFAIDTNGKISFGLNRKLVTPLGPVTVSGDRVITSDGRPLRPGPADVTHLVICQRSDTEKRCEAYQIGTGRKIKVEMNGNFIQAVERKKIVIEAAPGAKINVTDGGPPAKREAFGPARIDVEELHFQEAGEETEVDLERSRSGTDTDLSYDHITGEMKPIHGARVSSYSTSGWWGWPDERNDYPGEQECLQKRPVDWLDAFNRDDLDAKYSIFCFKTAEGDLGFLFVIPDTKQKPVAYYVYAYTWVR